MRKIGLKTYATLAILLFSTSIFAQNAIWQRTSLAEVQTDLLTQYDTPQEYEVFKLNTTNFKNLLVSAPERFNGTSQTIISLPMDNGKLEKFRVYEASNFSPELQAQYPNIRSYVAQGIDNPTAIARFSFSDYGMSMMISRANLSSVYLKSITQDGTYYMVYRSDQLTETGSFECEVIDDFQPSLPESYQARNANDGTLRTFRLALACTSDYANFHLNRLGVSPTATEQVKKEAVMSEFNVVLTRVNGIFERDLSVTMNLVSNNENLIFLNAGTDPYTYNDKTVMLAENQATCDSIIGTANYDLGHVLSSAHFGGLAYLRGSCNPAVKAGAVSGINTPVEDTFYFVIAHEMGHQYGANHTFNNECGGNRNSATGMEPGSGSTIMGYPGACPPNVQGDRDDYFHAISLQEMWSHVKHGSGQCGNETTTNNAAPIANAGPNRTIPASTPFILEGQATDPDDPSGASLTYSWEQMNPQPAQMPPRNTNTTGPMFRSRIPSESPARYMPVIETVINGGTQNSWEVVPAVSRSMNFRFTVRDNHPGGGASDSDNMRVTTDGNSGPFIVTSQTTATTWQTQTTETVTWDVAGTDTAPVNCTHVNIFFSTDNGFTYPVTIATNIPNTGSAVINVPNLNTTSGRLMVKAADNIFYQLNKGKITVTGEIGVNDFDFKNFAVYPNPSQGIFNLEFTPETADEVEVALYDLRGRLIKQNIFSDVSNGIFHRQLEYGSIDNGIYFLVVKNGGKTATKKLIKN